MTLEVPRGGRQPSQVAAARQAVALQRLSGATTPGGSRAQGLISTAVGLALPGAAPASSGGAVIGLATFEDDRGTEAPDGGAHNVQLDGPFQTVGDTSAFFITGGDPHVHFSVDSYYQVQADATISGLSAGDLCTIQLGFNGDNTPQLVPYSQYLCDANLDSTRSFMHVVSGIFWAAPVGSYSTVAVYLYGPPTALIDYCAVRVARFG